ncbi:MAG: sodium:solute symporter family protein [Planctomycetota bacterium]
MAPHMDLHPIDQAIVAAYCALSIAIGFLLARRAKGSIRDFFLSGSTLPWWVIGTSMIATTFAADTPLLVTGIVRTQGIWGNWLIWAVALMHVLAVVLFSKFWRRVGVLTDQELVEIRYSGRPARILRLVKAGYLATLYNLIVIGWVVSAMASILETTTGMERWLSVVVCVSVAAVYSVLSGFWGVVATDVIQFGIAMVASIVLAFLAVSEVGGMESMIERLGPERLSMLPVPPEGVSVFSLDFWTSPFGNVLLLVIFLWWGSQNSDGGGMIIQRMLAAKDERHARAGTLWFALGHYAIRFWPWVVVGVASILLVESESLKKPGDAYPEMVNLLLPVGLKGIMIAAFFAAFMSTIDTHVNWGASYLVNDVYRRFLKPTESDRHYVTVSRIVVLALTVCGAGASFAIGTLHGAFLLVISMGMGIGSVLILRWFWWRINAWSELSALLTSIVLGLAFEIFGLLEGPEKALRLAIIAPVSVAVWVTVTFLTSPVPKETLREFYRRARPGGWWGPVVGKETSGVRWGLVFVEYFAALALVLGATFGIGCLVFLQTAEGVVLLGVAAAGAGVLAWRWRD